MKRSFLVVIFAVFSFVVYAQKNEIIDFGKIVFSVALKENTVIYNGEITPNGFFEYALFYGNCIYITNNQFDIRFKIPFDGYENFENGQSMFYNISNGKAAIFALDTKKGKIAYSIKEGEKAPVFVIKADVDIQKSLILEEVIENILK